MLSPEPLQHRGTPGTKRCYLCNGPFGLIRHRFALKPHTACGTTRQVIFWTNNGNQEAKRIAMKNPRLSFINNIVIFSAAI